VTSLFGLDVVTSGGIDDDVNVAFGVTGGRLPVEMDPEVVEVVTETGEFAAEDHDRMSLQWRTGRTSRQNSGCPYKMSRQSGQTWASIHRSAEEKKEKNRIKNFESLQSSGHVTNFFIFGANFDTTDGVLLCSETVDVEVELLTVEQSDFLLLLMPLPDPSPDPLLTPDPF
jgi:hypothetical protein